jgi:hypothetical protein
MNEPNLNAIAADGRYYLANSDKQYDLIVVDAYRQPYIPFHLATREFFVECRKHLSPDGVLAINVGRAPRDYRLVDAITGTLGAVFPEVYTVDTARFLNTIVYAPNQPTQPAEVAANLALPADRYPGTLSLWVDELNGGPAPTLSEPHNPVYTDDHAPVERLVDQIVLDYVTGRR